MEPEDMRRLSDFAATRRRRARMVARMLGAKIFNVPVSLIVRAERLKEVSPSLFEECFNGRLTIDEAEARLAQAK